MKTPKIFISLISFFLIACTGGDGNSNMNSSLLTKEATLQGCVVVGARYDAGNGITGITDENGRFQYVEGSVVKFYIGDLYIGEVTPKGNAVSSIELTTQ